MKILHLGVVCIQSVLVCRPLNISHPSVQPLLIGLELHDIEYVSGKFFSPPPFTLVTIQYPQVPWFKKDKFLRMFRSVIDGNGKEIQVISSL
ncbi:hypothetical protein C5167_010691 [Papaver somniferum]|uniref:Uncharacterized protein n=1 Tax=Papaver somniferum TaxID=3469 RepID=A0A4Y7K259_PAPSO|nr:hypothetical protein C5167_010691 [Papaver somniferum]